MVLHLVSFPFSSRTPLEATFTDAWSQGVKGCCLYSSSGQLFDQIGQKRKLAKAG